MFTAYCPECGHSLPVETLKLGFRLTCEKCNTELEVINIDPLQLDWIDEDFQFDYQDEYDLEEETDW